MSKKEKSTWIGSGAQQRVARAIRASRKAAGLTLRQVQESTGIGYSHLCRIERGERSIPSLAKLESIALAVNLDPVALFAIVISDGLTPDQRRALAAHITSEE